MMDSRGNQKCHGFSYPYILPLSGILSVISVHLECKSRSLYGKGWHVFWNVLKWDGAADGSRLNEVFLYVAYTPKLSSEVEMQATFLMPTFQFFRTKTVDDFAYPFLVCAPP